MGKGQSFIYTSQSLQRHRLAFSASCPVLCEQSHQTDAMLVFQPSTVFPTLQFMPSIELLPLHIFTTAVMTFLIGVSVAVMKHHEQR